MNAARIRHRTASGTAACFAGAMAVVLAGALPAATWTPLGPPGGAVTALAAGPDGTLLGGTPSNGVFVAAWSPGTQPLHWRGAAPGPDGATSALVFARDGAWYAIAGDGELWRSRDAGGSWRSLRAVAVAAGATPTAATIASAASAPLELAAVFETTPTVGTLFLSHDGGDTWEPAPPFPGDVPAGRVLFDPNDADRLFALNAGGFWITEDHGQTWRSIVLSHPAYTMAVERGSRGRVYVWGTQGDPRHPVGAVYVSLDRGRTFLARAQLSALAVLAPDPAVPGGVFAVDYLGTILYSANSGRSFREQGRLPRAPALAFAVDPAHAGRICAAVPAGPFGRSVLCSGDRGRSWRAQVDGLTAADVLALAPSADGDRWWAGLGAVNGTIWSASHFGLWALDGAAWRLAAFRQLSVRALSPHPVLADELVAATLGGGLQATDDGGTTWRPLAAAGTFFTDLDRDPTEPRHLLATGDRGVVASHDGGASWHALGNLHVGAHLRFAPDGTAFYASLAAGEIFNATGDFDGLARVAADGSSRTNLLASDGRIQGIAVDPAAPAHLWLAMSGYRDLELHGALRLSRDGGQTWTTRTFGEAAPVTAVALAAGKVLVGTGAGVFRSTDDGATWNVLGSGLPEGAWISALVRGADGRWRAATRGAGVFVLDDEP